ncbi:MAG: nucleotidyltransferase domain-containing protein [Oligoflexia bacterium]|nr:nucleotidyltransferase domain-containing protein [Oligoflexia bacterium]
MNHSTDNNNNNNYGLSYLQLCEIINTFKEFKKIYKVLIIGSRAIGNFRHSSDIDLVLYGKNILLDDLSFLSLKLDELYLPYKFDLIIFDNIKNMELIEHIKNNGKIIYSSTSN